MGTAPMCPIVTIQGTSTAVPPWVSQLPQLHSLQLAGAFDAGSISRSLSALKGLKRLAVVNNNLLQELPNTLPRLRSLQHLRLHCCNQLKSLPAGIGRLKSLKSLSVQRCAQLQQLPDSICDLTALRTLNLNYCSRLTSLPAGLRSLPALDTLTFDGCPLLEQAAAEDTAEDTTAVMPDMIDRQRNTGKLTAWLMKLLRWRT